MPTSSGPISAFCQDGWFLCTGLPIRRLILAHGRGDQVLANFQLEIVETPRIGVQGDGVVLLVHGVGLVVPGPLSQRFLQQSEDAE